MEPERAAETHNDGVEAQNGAVGVCRPMVTDFHHFDEGVVKKVGFGSASKVKSRVHTLIKVKRRIRISIKMMRIHNLVGRGSFWWFPWKK
jgi:hypothetical protein